jgi:Na+/H+-dicarboxylate symporter
MKSESKRISFTWQLVGAMVLGVAIGLIFGPRAASMGEIGRLIIQAVKTFATGFISLAVVLSTVGLSWRRYRCS